MPLFYINLNNITENCNNTPGEGYGAYLI